MRPVRIQASVDIHLRSTRQALLQFDSLKIRRSSNFILSKNVMQSFKIAEGLVGQRGDHRVNFCSANLTCHAHFSILHACRVLKRLGVGIAFNFSQDNTSFQNI